MLSPATRLFTASLAALLLPVYAAGADTLSFPTEDEFAYAAQVSDSELSTLRGGFVGRNGMMIDFSFISRITQKLPDDSVNVLQDASFNAHDLANKITQHTQDKVNTALNAAGITQNGAQNTVNESTSIALNAGGLPDQPSLSLPVSQMVGNLSSGVIENTLSNTVISIQRQFVIDVMATDLIAASQMNARMNSVAYQNSSALHGL